MREKVSSKGFENDKPYRLLPARYFYICARQSQAHE
jgi:hypothetical protein